MHGDVQPVTGPGASTICRGGEPKLQKLWGLLSRPVHASQTSTCSVPGGFTRGCWTWISHSPSPLGYTQAGGPMAQAYLKPEIKPTNWGSWVYIVCFQWGCLDKTQKCVLSSAEAHCWKVGWEKLALHCLFCTSLCKRDGFDIQPGFCSSVQYSSDALVSFEMQSIED